MYDYQFIYRTFDGEKHFYIQRFDHLLSDEEIGEIMNSLFVENKDVSTAVLDFVKEVE